MSPTRRPLVIWQLTDRGFCSEICVLLMARLYCLDRQFDFALSSRHANIACQFGWRDYFEPFCEEVDSWVLRFHLFRARSAFRIRAVTLLQQAVLGRRFRSSRDLFRTCWSPEFAARTFTVPERGWVGVDAYAACRELLSEIWRLNAATSLRVAALRQRLVLADAPFAVLHIRRGDKIKEVAHVDPADYLARAAAVDPALRRFLVMTDDFAVVRELRQRWPDLSFATLCDERKEGHLQRRFNALPAAQRRDETDLLLAELEAAADARFFVGTYSSNIARFMALRYGRSFVHGVDGEYTLVSPRYRGPGRR
jgi:hypothetical protein